jgi:hypothetical protein
MRRAFAIAGVCVVLLALILPFDARASSQLDIDGETEAFALRVEYDIPLPASIGTEPHVIGEIRRTFGENSKGLAGAPTNFTAVTGGTVYDPWAGVNGNDHALKVGSVNTGINPPVDPHQNLPTAECFYPGNVSTTVSWPRDLRKETKPIPPASYANAECGAGPSTHLTAYSASDNVPGSPTASLGPIVHTGPLEAESVLQPAAGVVTTWARASAHDVNILDGAIRIGSVETEGTSTAEGPGGKDSTTGHVAIANISAGGQTFSIADDEITVAGRRFPIDSTAGQAFVESLNNQIAGTGCKLSVMGPASSYPQGFLLSRKPPQLGVEKDGTFAASMNGGLLILCDVPQSVSNPTTFTPQRVQILVGFEYTMARAVKDDAGFGVGDFIAGTKTLTTAPRTVDEPAPRTEKGTSVAQNTRSAPSEQAQALPPSVARKIGYRPLARSTRIIFVIIGIVLLTGATNFASRRLRELIGS